MVQLPDGRTVPAQIQSQLQAQPQTNLSKAGYNLVAQMEPAAVEMAAAYDPEARTNVIQIQDDNGEGEGEGQGLTQAMNTPNGGKRYE